jgi:hypothetical protein
VIRPRRAPDGDRGERRDVARLKYAHPSDVCRACNTRGSGRVAAWRLGKSGKCNGTTRDVARCNCGFSSWGRVGGDERDGVRARARATYEHAGMYRARVSLVIFCIIFFSFFSPSPFLFPLPFFLAVRVTSMYDVVNCITAAIRSCTALISVFTIRVGFHQRLVDRDFIFSLPRLNSYQTAFCNARYTA